MEAVLAKLAASGIDAYEASFTALDAFHRIEPAPVSYVAVRSDLVGLARSIEGLEFPGLPRLDASLATARGRFHFICIDSRFHSDEARASCGPLDLFRVPGTRRFVDPHEVYASLRSSEVAPDPGEGHALLDAAILLARYPYSLPPQWRAEPPRELAALAQRDLLSLILTGATPGRGLALLHANGFTQRFWPELALLDGTDQSKEFHPEGDAWIHTLETFSHRKVPDLILSLALLLHDTGKPLASASGGKRFAYHSELGTGVAARFMRRLGFDEAAVDTATWLVRWHMLPAALPRLPVSAVREALVDPRFPLLLELYRCDELSTFRGPEGYYAACAAYREWLRNRDNPFRDEEGRRLMRLYVEDPRSRPHKPAPARQGAAR